MRKYGLLFLKLVCGYSLGFGPLFGFLAIEFNIHFRQLVRPYILLFIISIVFVFMVYDARKYVNQPETFSRRFALAVLIFFLACIGVFTYYGAQFNILVP